MKDWKRERMRLDERFAFSMLALCFFVFSFLLGRFAVFLWVLYVPLAIYTVHVWLRLRRLQPLIDEAEYMQVDICDESEKGAGILIFGGGIVGGFTVMVLMTYFAFGGFS